MRKSHSSEVEPDQDLLTCGDCQREFLLSDIVKFIQHKVSRCNKENIEPLDDCCGEDDDDDDANDDADDPYRSSSNNNGADNHRHEAATTESLLTGIISNRRTSISAPISRGRESASSPPASSASQIPSSAVESSSSCGNNQAPSSGEKDNNIQTDETPRRDVSMDTTDEAETAKEVREKTGGAAAAEKPVENGIADDEEESMSSQVQAETGTEPSIFTCGTCKSVYSSSWFLLQHVQKSHGIKIYEEEVRDAGSPSPVSAATNSAPVSSPIVVKPDKTALLAEQLRNEVSPSLPATSTPVSSLASSFHHAKSLLNHHRNHKSPASSPRGASGGDMFSYPTPYMPGAPRQPLTAGWPYSRPAISSDYASMLHPELMMEQLRRLQGLMDHNSPVPGMPFIRPHSLDTTPQYSHSERLRLLAASGGSLSPSSKSLSRKPLDLPPFASQPSQTTPPSAFTTPTSLPTSYKLDSSIHDRNCQSPVKPKQCEFCGRHFLHNTVLAVHRRSHTGDEPFACPLCDYKSAQATKLRRHWHTTHKSGTVSPDLELNHEMEDTEEWARREAKAEIEMGELQRVKRAASPVVNEDEDQDQPTDLSHNSSRRSETSASPPAEERDEDVKDSAENKESEEKDDRASLLTEVMMNTGLSSLPEYKEAFSAALAEAQGNRQQKSPSPQRSVKHEADDTVEENGINGDRSPVKEEPMDNMEKDEESVKDGAMTDGDVTERESMMDEESRSAASLRRSPPSHGSSDYSGEHSPHKRIKRDSTSSTELSPHTVAVTSAHSFPPHSSVDHMFQRAAMDAAQGLYPGIWFPPTASTASVPRDFHFPGFLPSRLGGAENGLTSPISQHHHHHASAFNAAAATTPGGAGSPKSSRNSVPSPPGSASPNSVSGSGGGPMRRRNDTCEFCGKVFKNCSNLTVHRRSHTGEKPYKCQLCSYACAQSSKLTRHMRTHGRTGKDVYRCKFCCMPFSVPSTLEKHMRKCVENQQRAAAAAAAAAAGHLSPLSRHSLVATPSSV